MTSYDVTLEWTDGRTRTIAVSESQTVLEAAQRIGVRLPYDCRSGTCITCVGRLIGLEGEAAESDDSGESEADRPLDAADGFTYQRTPQALTDDERADGYVLLCIASPRADCRIEVGPRVRAEVGDSPWA
ncbi:2Fe-2S iron-sulfur cluster-binding protein [Natrinema amylolyticum]|uniref:2Fe-2S iron-sulfur cluster-binding protein n=1 Tax=Natrinema amylolyticum TaxID=2878679 RepID=UPI001CFB1A06|nr:2Fe-2S iron-sulfur cluster-binding protein [Natrinema amylolyticum]